MNLRFDYAPCEPEFTELTVNDCAPYTLPDGSQTSTPGVNSFTLINEEGCDSTVALTLNFNAGADISVEQTGIGCGNEVSFSISATGNGPFQFAIPAENLLNTNGNFTLGFGSFALIVTDSEGCSSTATLNNTTTISCPADFDQDFVVGVTDLLQFNASFGCTGDYWPYDLNSDGTVSVADLFSFLAAFGSFCQP
jgi:hypothetical protein